MKYKVGDYVTLYNQNVESIRTERVIKTSKVNATTEGLAKFRNDKTGRACYLGNLGFSYRHANKKEIENYKPYTAEDDNGVVRESFRFDTISPEDEPPFTIAIPLVAFWTHHPDGRRTRANPI